MLCAVFGCGQKPRAVYSDYTGCASRYAGCAGEHLEGVMAANGSALMRKMTGNCFILFWCMWLLFGLVQPAGATQVHTEPEGYHVHQIAHLIFAFSMGILIYWLRVRGLVRETAWRFIQYAAFFFILWNLDAMLVHYLDGRDDMFRMIDAGTWHARVHLMNDSFSLAVLYYLIKMDHLLCVPAGMFLYAGLRHLLKQARESQPYRGTR
jgi:hypothetical protein